VGVARINWQWGRGVGADPPAAGCWESGGKASTAAGARRQGGLGPDPPTMGDFCKFSRKIPRFYAYFT